MAKNDSETTEVELNPFLGGRKNKIQIQRRAGDSKPKGGNCCGKRRALVVTGFILLVLCLSVVVVAALFIFKCESRFDFLQLGAKCNTNTSTEALPVPNRTAIIIGFVPPAPPAEFRLHLKEYLLPKLSDCEDELTSQLATEKWNNLQNEKSRKKRVAGGTVADQLQFPWMVQIRVASGNNSADRSFTCGGSLINYRYVLTSAHCIRPAAPVAGYDSHVISVVLRNGEEIEIENATVHFNFTRQVNEIQEYKALLVAAQQNATISTAKKYSEEWSGVEDKGPYFNRSYRPFDIALIRLKQAVDLKIQRPICLPFKYIYGIQNSAGFDTQKATLFSAGWGYLGPDYEEESKELNYLHLPLINNTFCQRMFSKTKIRNEMICTGGVKGQDLCFGDSGGPLFISVEGRSFQVGVSSFGNDPCADSQDTEEGTMNSLSVFLNVSRFLPWILDNMWP